MLKFLIACTSRTMNILLHGKVYEYKIRVGDRYTQWNPIDTLQINRVLNLEIIYL
jgi:hypothetical protein